MDGFSDTVRSPFGDATVTLRRWELADAAAVIEALSDPEVHRWTPLPQPVSTREAREWIESRVALAATDQQEHLAILEAGSGEVAGGINVFFHDLRRAELGYFTTPRLRRRGLASHAAQLATEWVHTVGVERLEALIDVANDASSTVVQSAGFRREGVLRGFRLLHGVPRDMYMYARLAGDPIAA